MKYKIFSTISFFIISISLIAQSPDFDLTGYQKYAPLAIKNQSLNNELKLVHLAYSRLNFKWYASENLTTGFELRSSFQHGINSTGFSSSLNPFENKSTYFDLQKKWYEKNDILIESELNRLYADFTYHQFQVVAGRQRISWGMSWVWNPTDLFNPVSAVSLDSEEKPGVDAVRVIQYLGDLSKIEFALKPGKTRSEVTAVGLIKSNFYEYDVQLLSGWNLDRFVVGGGWTGEISGGGFRGEILYKFKRNYFPSTVDSATIEKAEKENFIGVISGDYTFENSVYLHAEILFQSNGATDSTLNHYLISQVNNELSPAKFSLFQEISYPFTPLISGRLFSIINPTDKSVIIGPSVTISVAQNWDFDATVYTSAGSSVSEFGNIGTLALARIKWSF